MAPLDVRAASTAAQKVRLDTIRTLALEARLVPTAQAGMMAEQLDYKLAQCVSRVFPKPDDGNLMHVVMTMTITFSGDGHPVGKVVVDYIAQYSVAAPLTPEETESFAGISAFMHCFPYFRADVQAMTAKLALPALTLPTITSGWVTDERVRVELNAPVSSKAPAKGKGGRRSAKKAER